MSRGRPKGSTSKMKVSFPPKSSPASAEKRPENSTQTAPVRPKPETSASLGRHNALARVKDGGVKKVSGRAQVRC